VSASAAQAAAFYDEAAGHGSIWGITDKDGLPAPEGVDGQRAMPFWSLRSRAERIVTTVPADGGASVSTQTPDGCFRSQLREFHSFHVTC
jgi:hypothetical protein